ncbi:MAG: formylglycine-generating enzyme family protein [Planctomycetia bacterium]|nr:formylglycine-generating enzyme family protein [Planctomycetia bacterium]
MRVFKRASCMIAAAGVALSMAAGNAQAAVPETVVVGNPGNTADTTNFGAVGYEFKIGKYEVTNAEYCEFLNAVAKTDTHELYDGRMAGEYGGIERSGDAGSYTYAVKDGWGKKPINYVTVDSCARFANWLTNGQGKGDTETGTYTINGDGLKVPDHAELAKGKTAKWAIANENEWYKAAYYDPKKEGGAGYWAFPAKSDSTPAANLNSNEVTEVGTHKDAVTAYGTYDQGGNVWEFNDSQSDNKFGLRGGSFYINDNENYMRSGTRYDVLSAKWPNYGFRVVEITPAK